MISISGNVSRQYDDSNSVFWTQILGYIWAFIVFSGHGQCALPRYVTSVSVSHLDSLTELGSDTLQYNCNDECFPRVHFNLMPCLLNFSGCLCKVEYYAHFYKVPARALGLFQQYVRAELSFPTVHGHTPTDSHKTSGSRGDPSGSK